MVTGGLLPAPGGSALRLLGNARLQLRPPRGRRGLSPPVFQRQRQLLGGLDAIAATALGLIERGIGGREQYLELGARRPAGNADRHPAAPPSLPSPHSPIRKSPPHPPPS